MVSIKATIGVNFLSLNPRAESRAPKCILQDDRKLSNTYLPRSGVFSKTYPTKTGVSPIPHGALAKGGVINDLDKMTH